MKISTGFRRLTADTVTLLLTLLLAGPVLLAGCSDRQIESRQGSPVGTQAKGITWFDGSIEDAFAFAETAGKPLFLYWGAEWCPPCHYLKNRIFERQEFIARMQNFIPVYLDGDTERAQILGEELEVIGYPTVIIFDPLGEEVMRMPSTVPADQYEEVLDAAVGSMKPVKTVLEEVLTAGPGSASARDMNLLAFYSWGQDSRVGLSAEEKVVAFRRLYYETPSSLEIEKSRFLGLYLQSLARPEGRDDADLELTEDERVELHLRTIEVLRDARLRNANLLWIDYYADAIIDLLQPEATPERQRLLSVWQAAADEMEIDDSLSVDDRLTATILKLKLATMSAGANGEGSEISGEQQAHARRQADWALKTVTDESELQTVVDTLAYLLETASLTDEAETMLLSKMHDTAAPYYFMSWIAGLKEDAGENELALEWHRKAYDASEGRYSRFRWGSTYLRRLMDLSPESTDRIEEDSLEVLGELLTHEDAFAGGNHSRLESLEAAYWTWNGDGAHEVELATIRDFVRDVCERYEATSENSQRARCDTFLVPQHVVGEAAL